MISLNVCRCADYNNPHSKKNKDPYDEIDDVNCVHCFNDDRELYHKTHTKCRGKYGLCKICNKYRNIHNANYRESNCNSQRTELKLKMFLFEAYFVLLTIMFFPVFLVKAVLNVFIDFIQSILTLDFDSNSEIILDVEYFAELNIVEKIDFVLDYTYAYMYFNLDQMLMQANYSTVKNSYFIQSFVLCLCAYFLSTNIFLVLTVIHLHMYAGILTVSIMKLPVLTLIIFLHALMYTDYLCEVYMRNVVSRLLEVLLNRNPPVFVETPEHNLILIDRLKVSKLLINIVNLPVLVIIHSFKELTN